ncbi:MAG: hypothetical protein FWC66_05895, partial [Oscillospiraceae bacterium]|nr:hypothetical protein [Oscillospiraceae bacterium]
GVVFGGERKEHHPATSWHPSKEGNLHRKLRASLKIISNTPSTPEHKFSRMASGLATGNGLLVTILLCFSILNSQFSIHSEVSA